jgi:hypothetical protein
MRNGARMPWANLDEVEQNLVVRMPLAEGIVEQPVLRGVATLETPPPTLD